MGQHRKMSGKPFAFSRNFTLGPVKGTAFYNANKKPVGVTALKGDMLLEIGKKGGTVIKSSLEDNSKKLLFLAADERSLGGGNTALDFHVPGRRLTPDHLRAADFVIAEVGPHFLPDMKVMGFTAITPNEPLVDYFRRRHAADVSSIRLSKSDIENYARSAEEGNADPKFAGRENGFAYFVPVKRAP